MRDGVGGPGASQVNNHAQCSSERYTNDQRVRFLNQNEVLIGSSTGSETAATALRGQAHNIESMSQPVSAGLRKSKDK